MNQKKLFFKPYGLRWRLALILGVSFLSSLLVFFLLYNSIHFFLSTYFEKSDFHEARLTKQWTSLQSYITNNKISSKNLQELKKWEYKQPLFLMELYDEGECIYSSVYDLNEDEAIDTLDFSKRKTIFLVQLEDMKVSAFLYSDFTYWYYVLGTAFSALASFLLFIILFLCGIRKLITYIRRLKEDVQILEGGNLEYSVSVEGNDEITDLAKSMNQMRDSFQLQLKTVQELHQSNQYLITEMSHDLRTPLTGILLYLEILRAHHYTTEQEMNSYLEKIESKARHMKLLSDQLFSCSLDSVPQKQLAIQTIEHSFASRMQGFIDDLDAQGFKVRFEPNWPSCFIQTDDAYIQRIFENLISNIIKYAPTSSLVQIDVIDSELYCGFCIINPCHPIGDPADSNGIGIQSIRNMMQRMDGTCSVEQTESAFAISLMFPKR